MQPTDMACYGRGAGGLPGRWWAQTTKSFQETKILHSYRDRQSSRPGRYCVRLKLVRGPIRRSSGSRMYSIAALLLEKSAFSPDGYKETTLLPFGLESADRSARPFLNIRASSDSRSTERRKTARSIPSGNPSRLTIRSQRTGRPQAFHKAGFDPTTPHTQSRNSQIDFQPAYSCSISAHARSHPCQPGAGSLWRSRSNNFSRPSI